MGLVWERDEAEQRAYVLSLASPTEKFDVGGNCYYLNGAKCWSAPKDPCVGRSNPEYHDIMALCASARKVSEFEGLSQLSFWFMHPHMDFMFKKSEIVKLTRYFESDQTLFGFLTMDFWKQQDSVLCGKREEMDKEISRLKHAIAANERKRKKETK